jgi:hypothetical protein
MHNPESCEEVDSDEIEDLPIGILHGQRDNAMPKGIARCRKQSKRSAKGDKANVMISLNKMLLCTGLALLLMTILRIASAQPLPADMEIGNRELAPFDPTEDAEIEAASPRPAEVLAEVLLSARGFAISGNNTRILQLAVESVRHVDPALVRKLLSSNRSLEEIKDMMRAAQEETTYRGAIRMERHLYPLFSIRFLPSGRNATLDADIAKPGLGKAPGDEIAVVGHITVTINSSQDDRIGQGKLIMAGGRQPVSYEVMLETWTDGRLRGE